jgi:hypothetical protein
MDCCKKCGSQTLFFRRVAALEITLRRPALVYETYCPICSWCGGALQSTASDAPDLRRRGQELALA